MVSVRVLVTGASGVFGRDICRRLIREGADVVAMARRDVPVAGVHFVRGDIRDAETVEKAMAGCDVVAHLAWAVTPLKSADDTRAINVGGTANVLAAMERTGCGRVVFASSVTAYGAHPDNPPKLEETDPLRPDPKVLYAHHKAQAEEMVLASGYPNVITRTAPAVGRTTDSYEFRVFATPMLMAPAGELPRWQFIHEEDVGRFHVEAILGERTGVVNVATPDEGLTIEEIAEVLGKRLVSVPEQAMARIVEVGWRHDLIEMDPNSLDGFRWMPVVDDTRLREQWGFHCAWTGREALEDLGRILSRTVYLGPREIELPWRLRYADTHAPRARPPYEGGELVDPAPPGEAGEFDSLVDPRFPTYSATNISEAFPGPMTPLSLDVSLDAMLAASDGMVDFLGLEDEIAHAQRARGAASFGHRIFANVSVVREMAKAMPGMSPEDVDDQFLGIPRSADAEPARLSWRDVKEGLGLLVHTGPRVAGFSGEVDRCERDARELPVPESTLCTLTDERLLATVGLLHDQLCQAWNVACISNMIAAAAQSAAEKSVGGPAGLGRAGTAGLESAGALVGVDRLARMARDRPRVAELIRSAPAREWLERVRDVDADFAAAFDDLVATYGHRGPGETELANPTFSDRPDFLADAVAKALDAPVRSHEERQPQGARARAAVRPMRGAMRQRERARDAVVRLTHGLRLAVRERARRLVEQGMLEHPDDVFYLTFDEVLVTPGGVADRIVRRRAERERLRGIELPVHFTEHWEPVDGDGDGADDAGGVSGIPAAPGTVTGPVRVVRDVGDPLEPGDVLVAHITDTGWTPLFSFAAAVVTDVGGALSHPAVVAREYGIPCVVGTGGATTRLRDGQVVRVDGEAGTVTVLEPGDR